MLPPPPLTVAVFCNNGGAFVTAAVRVMTPESDAAEIGEVLLQTTSPLLFTQFHPLPDAETKVKPDGRTSSTVTVDVVAVPPALCTVML